MEKKKNDWLKFILDKVFTLILVTGVTLYVAELKLGQNVQYDYLEEVANISQEIWEQIVKLELALNNANEELRLYQLTSSNNSLPFEHTEVALEMKKKIIEQFDEFFYELKLKETLLGPYNYATFLEYGAYLRTLIGPKMNDYSYNDEIEKSNFEYIKIIETRLEEIKFSKIDFLNNSM